MIYLGPWLDRRTSHHSNTTAQRELEQVFHTHLFTHGVAIQPGLSAKCPRPGWFRVTFTREELYMEEALSRLDRAMNTW